MATQNANYPTIQHRVPVLPEPANMATPPDGFDPDRDGAATWLALRMSRHVSDEI